jgi:transcriptional regulator with XRE-family HTH domain
MNNLHDNLKKLRNKAGYTQQEVADQLFVTRQCISRWEQGKTIPDIHSLDKLA